MTDDARAQDEAKETDRPQCTECHRWAPATETPHTLISGVYKWRVRRRAEGGIEWWCSPCWKVLRTKNDLALDSQRAMPVTRGARGKTG